MKRYSVPAWEFYNWKHEILDFPDSWKVEESRMKGHNATPLNLQDISEKLQKPIGTKPLSQLAEGKRKCCIIFDDMTRPTKQYQMLPSVLDELKNGGLSNDQIVFVMATGAHHGRLLNDFKKKKTSKNVDRYCYKTNRFYTPEI